MAAKKHSIENPLAKEKLVALYHQKSPATEAFRTLRTNLQYMSPDKKLEAIMITGSEAGIGKSTVSANLALTFAMTGKKTILVDADLRKPLLHKLFDLPNFQGLSSYLAGENSDLDALIKELNNSGLFLMPAGPTPPNPAELLGSAKMEALVKNFRENADIVIIDAPPILPVTDAVLLSRKVDGVLLIAEINETRKEIFEKGLARLKQVDANILGSVLNRYPVNKSSYYTYENYYYYGEK